MNSKRLTRSTEDRMLAGVCGGIAEYLEVDSTLVRLVFVALTMMGGPGLIIYIILMLIVPETPPLKRKPKRDLSDEDESSLVRSSIPVPDDDYAEAASPDEEPDSPGEG